MQKRLEVLEKEFVSDLESGLSEEGLLYKVIVAALQSPRVLEAIQDFVDAFCEKHFDIEKETFKDKITELSVKYSVNTEIINIIMKDYGEETEDILKGMFITPKFTVKINTTKISEEEYKQLLRRQR